MKMERKENLLAPGTWHTHTTLSPEYSRVRTHDVHLIVRVYTIKYAATLSAIRRSEHDCFFL